MSIGFATYLSISASVTLAIFGSALVLLIVWQDPRRRSNWYFGLSMGVLALFGAMNAVWQVPQQFDLEPKPLIQIVTSLYVGALILIFNFVIVFAEIPLNIRAITHLVSIPLAIITTGLIWTDNFYADFEPLATGAYSYRVQPLGYAGVGVGLLYLLSSIGVLFAQRSEKARELSVPMIMLVASIFGFGLSNDLRRHGFTAIMTTISVILLGRLMLKYQVFKPLIDLNAELQRKNEQLSEATRMKAQFLANMSHELRTPLNSIIGYTDLVLNRTYGELTELQGDRLKKVVRNGHLLLELINDVLDLSKIEAGRLELTLGRVPTGELLDSLMQTFEPKAREKGLMLVRGYSGLPALWVDETRARQILANLISNAIKYTEQGVVIVRGHFDAEQRQVIISVTDTGIGIDPANQERVFEAFHQADHSLLHPHEGTGLGLVIARRLTEMHSGRIWFESVVGRGTTFHVALPAAEDVPQPSRIFEPRARNTGPVVLAIDDDAEAIEVIQGYLESANYRVYGACSPNDGLKLAHELKPVLITLDIRMPGVDGWQVLEALRRDPATAPIPVLIITATDDRNLAPMVGAEGFITKPVQPAILMDNVRRLLAVPAEARP